MFFMGARPKAQGGIFGKKNSTLYLLKPATGINNLERTGHVRFWLTTARLWQMGQKCYSGALRWNLFQQLILACSLIQFFSLELLQKFFCANSLCRKGMVVVFRLSRSTVLMHDGLRSLAAQLDEPLAHKQEMFSSSWCPVLEAFESL